MPEAYMRLFLHKLPCNIWSKERETIQSRIWSNVFQIIKHTCRLVLKENNRVCELFASKWLMRWERPSHRIASQSRQPTRFVRTPQSAHFAPGRSAISWHLKKERRKENQIKSHELTFVFCCVRMGVSYSGCAFVIIVMRVCACLSPAAIIL